MRVLIVDDEHTIADTIAKIFQLEGHEALAAYTAEEAVGKIAEFRPELLITDVLLKGMHGIELGTHCRHSTPSCKVLLISGHNDTADLLDQARARGEEFEIVAKPINPKDLLAKALAMLSDGRASTGARD